MKAEPKPEPELSYADVIYGEWTGPRKRMKLKEHKAQAIIKAPWAYLLPDGCKKKLYAKHFYIVTKYDKKPDNFDEVAVAFIMKQIR